MGHLPDLAVEVDSRITPAPKADSFDRADSATTLAGALAWTALNGAWGIDGNRAYPASIPTGQGVAVVDTGWANGTVQSSISGSVDGGVVGRAVDNNNYLMVVNLDTSFVLYKRDAGAFVVLATVDIAGSTGGPVALRCIGNRVDVLHYGALVLRRLLTSAEQTKYGAATKHGIRAHLSGVRHDDFAAIPAQADSMWDTPPSWTRIDAILPEDIEGLGNGIRFIDSNRIGAPNLWTAPEASELVLTLDNRNGYLDPSFPTSPYAGLLTRDRQIRVRYVPTNKNLFHGLVERWPVRWSLSGADATTTLLATCRVGALGRSKLPPSLIEHKLAEGVDYPRPKHLYLFRESSMSNGARFGDSHGALDGVARGAPPKGVGENLVPYGPSGGIVIENNPNFNYDAGQVQLPSTLLPTMGASANFSVLGVVRGVEAKSVLPLGDLLSVRLRFGIYGAGTESKRPQALMVDAGGVERSVAAANTLANARDEGTPHTVWAVRHTDSRLYLHCDKTAWGSVLVSTPAAPTNGYQAGLGAGALGMLAVWHSTVADAAKNQVYDDIFAPWAGDSAETRLAKLLGVAAPGVPSAIPAGATADMLPVNFQSRSPLVLIGDVCVAKGARLWSRADGTLIYRPVALDIASRSYGVGGAPVTGLEVADQAQPYSSVRITNDVGNEVVVGDTVGAELTLTSGGDLTLIRAAAARILDAVRSSSEPGVSSITLAPYDPAVGYDDTLAIDLYDTHEVSYERPWAGGTVTETREVCEVRHRGTPQAGLSTVVRYRTAA